MLNTKLHISGISLAVMLVFASSFAAAGPFKVAAIDDVNTVYPLQKDWRNLKILHIGDSHVSAGFKSGLQKRFKKAGARYIPNGWVGSRSKSWVVSGKLKEALQEHHPNVVIVTLGTNAMKIPQPKLYAPWIKNLAKRIGNRRCYWVGPPPLLEDTQGLNNVIKEASIPCQYFDTRAINLKKTNEGFHLTKKQGEKWAEQVWQWMNNLPID